MHLFKQIIISSYFKSVSGCVFDIYHIIYYVTTLTELKGKATVEMMKRDETKKKKSK